MSRFAEVIVLAKGAEQVMEPLTLPDEGREWYQCFRRVDDSQFYGSNDGSAECYVWIIQFQRQTWQGLLPHLESLPWPDPYSVQVLVRDEEDHCFGLWMIYDGKLSEVPLPRTERYRNGRTITGVLSRSDRSVGQSKRG